MCGIVGALDLTGNRDFPAEWLRAMTMAIAHRGPDDEYFHREPGLALGTRRLAIVDLAGGRQPLANEDETVWVSFNRVIRPGHYVRVRDGRIDRAVSYSERDRWHNVGPFGLMRSASDRLCLAASSSIHPDASPRAIASASPGQGSRTILQSRRASARSPSLLGLDGLVPQGQGP